MPTANGLTATGAIERAGAARDGELRSTFVDAEEAAMQRAMQRLNGDDQQRKVGNSYSQQNRARTQARLNAMKAEGIVPMKPYDEETMRKKQEANAKAPRTISERAIRVPLVGVTAAPQRRPLVDCLPKRRGEAEIRTNEGNFVRPAAPPGAIVRSSDSRKDCMLKRPLWALPEFGACASSEKEELALRNQFYGKTPQEILSEDPRPHRPAAAASAESDEQQLHNQIVDEIADRQSFLDNMARLGQGHVHQQRIEGEIAERVHDLKRLEPYLQEAGNSSGGGAG